MTRTFEIMVVWFLGYLTTLEYYYALGFVFLYVVCCSVEFLLIDILEKRQERQAKEKEEREKAKCLVIKKSS